MPKSSTGIDVICADKNNGWHLILLQYGKSICIIIIPPVIKSDEDRVFGNRTSVLDDIDKLFTGEDVVAFLKIGYLFLKTLQGDLERVAKIGMHRYPMIG